MGRCCHAPAQDFANGRSAANADSIRTRGNHPSLNLTPQGPPQEQINPNDWQQSPLGLPPRAL
eukprot:9942095-Lingulodinium_polyedra.AAC.1